jgi:hypothetical protein
MKSPLHQHKQAVFESWVRGYCKKTQLHYLWPQICYDPNTLEIIHVVFEKNSKNEDVISWPVKIEGIEHSNIDFTTKKPTMPDGSEWNFREWHKIALGGCPLTKQCEKTPASFWEWRLQTIPQGNLACDLDFLYKKGDKVFGIEATEIYYIDECPENPDSDVYEHFIRLLRLRKGGTGGFNIMQLRVQYNLLQRLGGKLLFLLHKFDKTRNPYELRTDKVSIIEITDEVLRQIETIIKAAGEGHQFAAKEHCKELIKPKMKFMTLESVMQLCTS